MNYKINYSDDCLMHWGVKGMKWGKHKKALDKQMVNDSRDAGRAQNRLVSSLTNLGKSYKVVTKEQQDQSRHPSDRQTGYVKEAISNAEKAKTAVGDNSHELPYKLTVATNSKNARDEAIKEYNSKYESKASAYQTKRDEKAKHQEWVSQQEKASRDVGRAVAKDVASNVGGKGKTVESNAAYYTQKAATAEAKRNATATLTENSSKLTKYDAKTQKKVDKILSKTISLSSITYEPVNKAKAIVNKLFGKKGGK